MPAVHINASDLFAICVAEKVLKQHEDTPIYRKLMSVFTRIESSLPEKVSIHPSWVDQRISIIQHHKTSITPQIWSKVADALQRFRTLNITYQKPNAPDPGKRKVDPYQLLNFQGEWYILGYCHLRQKILTFAVSRIKKASIGKRAFKVPDDFNFETSTSRFGIFSSDQRYKVKILFAKEQVPYVLEREWHPSQQLSHNKDGSLVLELTTNHLFEIKQWVLSWGHAAKVLAPEQLRNEVIKELTKTLNQYDPL